MRRDPCRGGTAASSPLIGLVLVVAITVTFATVLGTFAIGLGDHPVASGPDAELSFDYEAGTDALTVVHEGGDDLSADRVAFAGDVDAGTAACLDGWAADGETITDGDACELDRQVREGDAVVVVWEGEDGSMKLDEWDGSGSQS